MDRRMICRRLRHEFNVSGGALLIYYAIMNLAVFAVLLLDVVFQMVEQIRIHGTDFEITDEMLADTANNGIGYVLAVAIGFFALVLWKKGRFCFREIWRSNRSMKFGSFWALLCIFISGQAFIQLYAYGIEWLLNQFGLSAFEAMQVASGASDSISMFVYSAFLAPIFEEILFRGLILKTLLPTGKKFAIFASAYLFGVFHGNIIQTPFAFMVGLILGYVAAEYSMGWAILLHMINNLVLGELMSHFLAPLPVMGQEVIYTALNWGCAIGAIAICICKRKAIKQYLLEKRMHPLCFKSFFTSPVVLVFTGLMLLNICLIFLV